MLNMKNLMWTMVAGSLAMTGCDNDNDDGNGDTHTHDSGSAMADAGGSTTTDSGSTTTDSGSTTTDSGSTTTDSGSATTDSGPTASGACTNKADMAAIAATYDDLTVPEIASACGRTTCLSMFGTDGFNDCVATCVNDATGESGPSDECTACYVGSVRCGGDNCIAVCLSGGEACDACVCGDNAAGVDCIGEFEACSGINSTTCDGV